MKITILDGYTLNPGDLSWEGFKQQGELTVYDRTPYDSGTIIQRIGDSQAVLTNKTPITPEILAACPAVKYIGVLATGYNVVDIQAARDRGIPVTNVPAYGTSAVAQFTIAMLLEICHRIGHHSSAVFAGRWEQSPDFSFWEYPLIDLAGKTFGIIGYGRIGQATGKLAQAFGMNVIFHDRAMAGQPGYRELNDLLMQADVISLHCPLTPETEHIINKDSIARMKDRAIILNTARGPLVHEQDLADALNSGKLYAAGVDVVSAEPIVGDNPLLNARNCYITPHIAWASKEARGKLMDIAVGNLAGFVAGEPVNVVN